ncbi:hypothetical protein IKF32_00370 [Candidatus Saccharibacteria bacterium]|nr:hypothetical protein [Candidatus Saccharibacteria bacterium]
MRKTIIVFIVMVLAFLPVYNVMAISEGQSNLIKNKCDSIQEDLKQLQVDDSRVRVYLGALYERVLTKYIVPLNVRLVENSISDVDFIENQNNFVAAKIAFVDDFVNYQRSLEELTLIDCKKNTESFYQKLTVVREKRAIMAKDVAKLSGLMTKQKSLVLSLMENL